MTTIPHRPIKGRQHLGVHFDMLEHTAAKDGVECLLLIKFEDISGNELGIGDAVLIHKIFTTCYCILVDFNPNHFCLRILLRGFYCMLAHTAAGVEETKVRR